MSAYYNDIDSFCCNVLQKNMDQGHIPNGYIDKRDIRDINAEDFVRYDHVHLFAGIGGFPIGNGMGKISLID